MVMLGEDGGRRAQPVTLTGRRHGAAEPDRGPGGRPDPICLAPFTSLWLDTSGVVRSCCMNHGHPLGRIGPQSLREIWDGRATRELRRRLEQSDLGLGCEECALAVADGNERTAFFHTYDGPAVSAADPTWPRQLELSLSNVCNLQCTMCDGEHSSMIRVHREHRAPLPEVYDDAFFEELDDFLPHLERVVFMGGEPFLARPSLRVMERLIELDLHPQCVVISNGTLWNDRIERILRNLPVHVTISIDGSTPETVEAIRVGVDFGRLVENMNRYRAVALERQQGFQLCYCLMRQNVHEFGSLLEMADGIGAEVYVKRVVSPTGMSLQHAPLDELRRTVDALDADDARLRASLTTNLPTWETEVDSLQRLLERRLAEHRSPTPGAESGREPVGSEERARAALTEPGPAHDMVTLTADHGYIVCDVASDHRTRWAQDLRCMLGESLDQLVPTLAGWFGALEHSNVRRPADGNEFRTLEFGTAGGRRTIVRAVLVDDAGGSGSRWMLALPST